MLVYYEDWGVELLLLDPNAFSNEALHDVWPPFQTWEKVERTTAILPCTQQSYFFFYSNDVNSRGFGRKKSATSWPKVKCMNLNNLWHTFFFQCVFLETMMADVSKLYPSIFGVIYRSFTYCSTSDLQFQLCYLTRRIFGGRFHPNNHL